MKKVLPLLAALGLFLAACGAKGTPTPDVAAMMQTANAMAFTMSAQTAAAMPTNTPVPPTATATLPPPASPTLPLLPTFPAAQPSATSAAAGGACNSLMAPNPGGPQVYVVIDNRTKGSLTFSLYLNETAFSCGFVPGVGYIGANQSIGVTIPEGCYWPSAWVNDPKKPRSHSGPQGCIHGDDKITIAVEYEGIRWIWP